MAQSVFTGPLIALGGLAGGQRGSAPAEYSNEIGPSLFWNGVGLLDQNGVGSKDKKGAGAFKALLMAAPIIAVNAAPVAGGAALTVAAGATSGTPLVNISTFAAGLAPNLPVKY